MTAASLRVMTFNVRGFYHDDGANAWPHREALNIATIRQHAPDLIGMQEVQGSNLRAFHRELTDYHYVAWPHYYNHPPHEWPAIFWRPERLRPVESGGFWLSETPEVFSGSWGTDCIRSAAWVKFRCRITGVTFVHMNTHLDHRSELARVEGARLIVERVRAITADVDACVLTGDFNAPVGSPAYRVFADAWFADAHIAAQNDDDPARSFTYHGWEGEGFRGSDDPLRRIDWILTRDGDSAPMHAVRCEIIRDHAGDVYPSDHYPVMATIALMARPLKSG